VAAKVLAMGDSVLLGAAAQLGRALGPVEVDAAVGRPMGTALEILDQRKAQGRLRPIVIIHLGDNGPITPAMVQHLFDDLSDVPHVVVMTLRINTDWETHNNNLLIQAAQSHSNVILVDWYAASAGKPNLFWNDGEHLRPEGATYYASLIAAALQAHGVSTH
jgi:hypothetical protein